MDDMLAIRTLINTLRIPSLETRVRHCHATSEQVLKVITQEVVLEMFFNLLKITEPEWHQTFIDGRRLTSMLAERALH